MGDEIQSDEVKEAQERGEDGREFKAYFGPMLSQRYRKMDPNCSYKAVEFVAYLPKPMTIWVRKERIYKPIYVVPEAFKAVRVVRISTSSGSTATCECVLIKPKGHLFWPPPIPGQLIAPLFRHFVRPRNAIERTQPPPHHLLNLHTDSLDFRESVQNHSIRWPSRPRPFFVPNLVPIQEEPTD